MSIETDQPRSLPKSDASLALGWMADHPALSVMALDLSGIAAALFDHQGNILSANQALLDLTGYESAELLAPGAEHFYVRHAGDKFLSDLLANLANSSVWRGDIRGLRKNGTEFPAHLHLRALPDLHGHFVGVVHDLTRTRSNESLIYQLRYFDTLTGLPNWAWLQDELTLLIAAANQERAQLAVMLIDLNRFKAVNDALGEAVGDYLISTLAERLRTAPNSGSLVARRDGDEFCVVLPNANLERATSVAASLLALVAQPIQLAQQQYELTACIGISLYPEHGEHPTQLIGNAGAALHAAKRMQNGGAYLFDESLIAEAQARRRIEEGLQRAQEQGEFFLCYQPQVDLRLGQIVGVEALLRWREPGGKLISPVEFIPVAEQTGHIITIGQWVLEQACRQGHAWREAGINTLRMAVNLSPCQFKHGNLVQLVRTILADTGFPAEMLELEITEGALMDDPARAEAVITELRELGVSFAVDDFGTGYSSLAYLKRFPLERLKIDRSFVIDCYANRQDGAIIDSIIGLSRNLELEVVAEGVEIDAQLAFLKARGCDQVQGYLYSRPLPANDFVSWLRTTHGRALP